MQWRIAPRERSHAVTSSQSTQSDRYKIDHLGLGDRLILETFDRARPVLTSRNRHFWTGGAHNELLVLSCENCGYLVHPPRPICGRCRERTLSPLALSGIGSVYSFTVSYHPWVAGLESPYVVAQVELAEQAGVLILTNIVEVDCSDVHIGMKVEVCFSRNGDCYIPLFRPLPGK